MGRIKSNLIELFIDKAILAVAVIIAIWILLAFVIGSPNAVKYAGKKVAPGQIDESIHNEALKLQEKLKKEPQDTNSYQPKAPLYLSLIEDSIKNVNTNINFPLPDYLTGTVVAENRIYQLPKIELIGKPSIAVATMTAFVPTEELSTTLTYDKVETKLADIDLVTVESGINAKQLYESFRSAFAGKDIRNEWREEQYAKPVFAKVELQQRTLLSDGSWSQWAEVPRTKICHLKKTLQLPTQADEYEIPIAMVQFVKMEIRDEILQPPVYDNAIPAEPWLSPSLYNEREKRLKKEQEELKKQQLEAEKSQKLQEKASSIRQPTIRKTQTQSSRGGSTGGGEEGSGGGGITQSQPQIKQQPTTVQRQRQQPQPSQRTKPTTAPTTAEGQQTKTEEQQYREIHLSENTSLNPAELEKLVFWAHDDTTKPGEKHQYRIRIGILNPIAGKSWFSEEQKDLKDQVVLFSNFSEPTETIEIPNKLHFFATDIREIGKGNTADKIVEVKVARYTFGNWVTKTFSVKNGEQIGTIIDAAGTKLEQAGIETEPINLATGYIMVDTRQVTEWIGTGSLRVKEFYKLLYCKTGEPIQTMPIKERYWPDEITKTYKEIEQAEAGEPVVLLTRDEAARGEHNIQRSVPSKTRPSTSEIEGPSVPSRPGNIPPGPGPESKDHGE